MHIYALLFLVFVFIIFLAIFPILIGKVGSVSAETGDLFAEQVLAKVMSENGLIENEVIYFQDALNSDLEKEKVTKKIGEKIVDELKRAKYSNFNVKIIISDEDDRDTVFSRQGIKKKGTTYLQGYSTACWPFSDGKKIKFIEVYVGSTHQNPAFVSFARGNQRC